MRLYFRADTRSPKTIFQTGFKPRNNLCRFYENNWWQQGIRKANELDSLTTTAPDAEMNNVVCLSKKLESVPLFPVCDQFHADYNSEIYLYVMALPDAELPQDFNTPQNIDVFDMHAYQSQQIESILGNSTLSVNPAMAGYVLSGYEVFAKEVSTQNIICAVKCKRSDFAITAGVPVFTKAIDDVYPFSVCQTRYFELGHEVYINDEYSQDEQYQASALEELARVKAKGLQPTTSVQEALEDTGIQYDKNQIHTSTYFWQELKSLHFGMAFFSVLESIYYAAVQLFKLTMNKLEQKPLEKVTNLPDSMQDTPKKMPLSFYGRYFTTVGVVTGETDRLTAHVIRNI